MAEKPHPNGRRADYPPDARYSRQPPRDRTAGRSRSLRSLMALEAALGPGTPDLAHRKVASRFEARSAEWDNIGAGGTK